MIRLVTVKNGNDDVTEKDSPLKQPSCNPSNRHIQVLQCSTVNTRVAAIRRRISILY
jgi:hypothetical protein